MTPTEARKLVTKLDKVCTEIEPGVFLFLQSTFTVAELEAIAVLVKHKQHVRRVHNNLEKLREKA